MGERDDARRSIEDARERMSEIAEELARRASPERLRARAKEEAVKKSTEIRDRALGSPMLLGAFGGAMGWMAGSAIARRYDEKHQRFESQGASPGYTVTGYTGVSGYPPVGPEVSEVGYGTPEYPESSYAGTEATAPAGTEGSEESGIRAKAGQLKSKGHELREKIGERVSGGGEQLRHKASDVGHRASEMVSNVRSRIPPGSEIRSRGSELFHRAEGSPPLLVIGGLVIGALAALSLPVSDAERRKVRPVKDRAREGLRGVTDRIEERIGSSGGDAPFESSTVH